MIGVVGLGFVGLTTALGLAHKGHVVLGFDIDGDRAGCLRGGRVPFHEPHLARYLKKYYGKKFFLCDSLADVVRRSKVIFFCVGTPALEDGAADLSYLKTVIADSLKVVKPLCGKVFVIKSTVPPLTASQTVSRWILDMGFSPGVDVGLASNPEFLREGYAWEDFIHPDRVVIGADDKKSLQALLKIYKPFKAPVFLVSLSTAEFIKYLSNCFLATMISFSNEMAMLAETMGSVDVAQAFHVLHQDKRWSGKPAAMASYAYPGCGFGGYCLPKDTQAIYSLAKKVQCPTPLLAAVIEDNSRIKEHVVNKIVSVASTHDTVGILGLAFKPGSDDVRETPALDIIRSLLARGFENLVAYDPLAVEVFKRVYNLPITYAHNLADVAKSAKVLVLLTAWPDFRKQSGLFKGKVVVDGRYFLKGRG